MYRGLPRGIYALFAAAIVNAVGNLVYPFLTFFLTQRLGYSSARAGMFILLLAGAYVPGSLIGGKLADIIGRKKVLVATSVLGAVFLIPCALLGNSPAVPWFLIGSHFFIGAADPTHEAITADMTSGEQRQAAFSLIYLGHNIGFSIGPMLAGFLFTHALPWLFIGDAVTTFLAIGFVIIMVPESKPSAEQMRSHGGEGSDEKAETGGLFPVLLRRPFLLAFSIISLLLTFVYSQFSFSLPLQLKDLFQDRGPMLYGILMTVNALVVIFFTTPLISLTKKIKPVLSVAAAALLFMIGFGFLSFVHSIWLFAFSTCIWTLGEILQATNTNVYIANHTPISHRGRFNSILPIIIGAGYALGPPVMGQYIEATSIRAVWPLVSGIALFGSAVLVVLYLLENNHKKAR